MKIKQSYAIEMEGQYELDLGELSIPYQDFLKTVPDKAKEMKEDFREIIKKESDAEVKFKKFDFTVEIEHEGKTEVFTLND